MHPATANTPTPELPPGSRVGRYEILAELGRGGMGIVYRARDATLGRDVALKSPLAPPSDADGRQRFLVEARAASRLSHPSIVPIFEAFEDGGRPWLAMALADGHPLRTIIDDRGALPLDEALRHGEALAEALEAAHRKHVLHRDLTPNNIFLTPEGHVVLMDFGLACFFARRDEESGLSTHEGSGEPVWNAGGTPGYMSPEQLLGRPLDASADIFSLGAVLYEMSTGIRAFAGANRSEVFDATLNRDPPPLARFVRALPPELDRIIGKAIAKRSDERYATAQDLLVDLRRLRRQIEQGAPDRSRRTVRSVRRWLRWSLVAAAVAGAVTIWAIWRPRGLPVGEPRQLTSGAGWEADPAISPDGSSVAYASEIAGNVDLWVIDARGGEPLRLTDDAAVDRDPAWFPDGSALAFVSERNGHRAVWKVPRLGGSPSLIVDNAQDPAIAPDGARIAFSRLGPRGELRVFVAPLADPGAAGMISTAGNGVWDHVGPAWSPDGTRICYAAQRDLWITPATGGNTRRLTTAGAYDRDPVWSPDGRFVYFWSIREGTTALWRIPAGGGSAVRVTLGSGPEIHPTLSRDGSRLAYSTFSENPNLVVHDLSTGQERQIGEELYEGEPVLSPDELAVAFVSDRQTPGSLNLWLQPLTSAGEPAGPPRRLTTQEGTVSQPSFSPDGRWVAYHRVLNGQRDIWIVPVAGGTPVQFTVDPAVDTQPDWSPDGRTLAFVSDRSGTQHIWVGPVIDGQPAGPAREVTTGSLSQDAPAWSPDGSHLAYVEVDDQGTREVWTVAAEGGTARQVTVGAVAWRVVWDRQTPSLFVSGFWNRDRLSLRRVALDRVGGAEPSVLAWFDKDEARSDFDVSRDGRLLVFSRAEQRGDVWVLDARRGRY